MKSACFVASLLASALLAAGCASFDGRGLQPGKSTEQDVVKSMGQPDQRLTLPNGDTALYFSRLPEGRAMYVATVSSDGVLRGIDQRLDYANIKRIVPNNSTANEVREILGPPWRVTHMGRLKRDVWEYPWRIGEDRRILWVQLSADGVVREVIEMHDYESDPPSGADSDGGMGTP
ncbi:MAG TPA: hypothetical protein VK043_03670 [Burkholderiales bacterium]|nr:hypothetical protein [Burkholderiales bacterium]